MKFLKTKCPVSGRNIQSLSVKERLIQISYTCESDPINVSVIKENRTIRNIDTYYLGSAKDIARSWAKEYKNKG